MKRVEVETRPRGPDAFYMGVVSKGGWMVVYVCVFQRHTQRERGEIRRSDLRAISKSPSLLHILLFPLTLCPWSHHDPRSRDPGLLLDLTAAVEHSADLDLLPIPFLTTFLGTSPLINGNPFRTYNLSVLPSNNWNWTTLVNPLIPPHTRWMDGIVSLTG